MSSSGMCHHVDLVGLQPPAHVGSSLADFPTLNMEAIRFSETSVHKRSSLRHIREDGILYSHRYEKPQILQINLLLL
jgi:hypothetical protein